MRYYTLRLPSDPKVIGVDNGIAQVEIRGDKFFDQAMYHKIESFFQGLDYWSKESFVPDFEIHFEYVEVLKNAILTDFLSFTPHLMASPFMISQRVVTVFENFNIQNYYLYPVALFKEDDLTDLYRMFYCPLLDYDMIDFSRSLFSTGSALRGKKFHSFATKREFLDFLHKDPFIKVEELALSALFDKKLDFFMGRIGGMFVSERLKKAMEIEGLTGINVLESKSSTSVPEVVA